MTARTAHPSEEDLMLHFYGESSEPAAIHNHLAACHDCRSGFAAITRTLTMVAAPAVPRRGDLYGLEVWQRIRPLLPPREPWTRSFHVRWSTLTVTAAMAVFTIVAFVAGRYWPSADGSASAPPRVATLQADADERARNVAIIDHLERSERVLLDLSNVDGPDLDVVVEQAWAADLVDTNRLMRDAAVQAGETTTASVNGDTWKAEERCAR